AAVSTRPEVFTESAVMGIRNEGRGLKVWRTLRRNLLKSLLAWLKLWAVSGLVFKILALQGSAVGSNWLAHLLNQGFLAVKGSQQGSFWSQLVVKADKSWRVVLKVRVKNKSGWVSAVPSKLASILSLKR
ncbi:12223_t:CDS:2, partial [Funneliformis geosporum]